VQIRRRSLAYAFICDPAHARGELIELIHFQMFPRWLIKTINNGVALRPGDVAARDRSLAALERLSQVYQAWRTAKLPVAVAAE
jgi:hypothetical protein